MTRKVPCIECGKQAHEVGGDALYPHRPDLYEKRFWRCECGAYVGCHPGTNRPLGYPAGPRTRKARNEAHDAFDPLWKPPRDLSKHKNKGKRLFASSGKRFTSRPRAYAWLAAQMGMAIEDCHIGMMSAEQAMRVKEICEAEAARFSKGRKSA